MSVLLDRFGDAQCPPDYELVEDEVTFLAIADRPGKWFIRGAHLCKWAESICSSRGVQVREAFSPLRRLRDVVPALNEQQAVELADRLRSRHADLIHVDTPQEVAELLYGTTWRNWRPSLEHAAEWLLWLEQQRLSEAETVLMNTLVEQWQQEAHTELAVLYQANNADAAQEVLEAWLGIADHPGWPQAPEFPLDIPAHWLSRASEAWRMRLVETAGMALDDLLRRKLSQPLRQLLAETAFKYFEENPQHLHERWLKALSPHLSSAQGAQLRKRLRPPEPSDVPESPEHVLSWFRKEYLPFRQWQHLNNDQQALVRVGQLARQFAEWYLGFYSSAVIKVSEYLGISRTAAIQRRYAHSVALLIILDGLHQLDAHHLLNKVLRKTGRLTKREQDLIFAPLPTITSFAKQVLLKGVLPIDCVDAPLLGEDISESKSPVKRLANARPGDVFIWRIQEPDHTYHDKNHSEMLEHEIEGQLEAVAQKIVEVVQQVPPTIPLHLLLTTDHGRLLGVSRRCLAVPPGMQAHGRAAWGPSGRVFPAAGFIIDEKVAFLYGERFGLPEDVAIILDESAFRTNDGKQGQERYAHGGIFPEEVIIPWIVLARDFIPQQAAEIPRLRIEASGKGVARQQSTLTIRVHNANEIPLVLGQVTLHYGPESDPVIWSLGVELPALTRWERTLELGPWPNPDAAKKASASAQVIWPTGECVEIQMPITLESEVLYRQDLSVLDDLGL